MEYITKCIKCGKTIYYTNDLSISNKIINILGIDTPIQSISCRKCAESSKEEQNK